jgi:hypothetical protein
VESVNHPDWSIIGRVITDPCFQESWLTLYQEGRVKTIEDIYTDELTPCHVEFLSQYQVRANLVVPILLNIIQEEKSPSSPHLWGLLIAHECSSARKWQPEEINFLQQLGTQVAIAIQQATLLAELQKTNQALKKEIGERQQAEIALKEAKTELELRVRERTAQLLKANEKLQGLNNQLIKSNQELEQFAYIASHDLREPLRMVTSFTELLGKRYSNQLGAEGQKIINFAIEGATRMEALINDLLSYSRLGTRKEPFQTIDCEEVLDITLSNLQVAIAETNTQIIRDSLPIVRGDRAQLVQLFQNLIDNAIKYRSQQPPVIEIQAESQQNQWLFSIKDNGIGIAPQYFRRIFKIFQRLHTRDEYPGTGIGLAICQKIVEQHGGKIWVESELEKGATFYFSLPAVELIISNK